MSCTSFQSLKIFLYKMVLERGVDETIVRVEATYVTVTVES